MFASSAWVSCGGKPQTATASAGNVRPPAEGLQPRGGARAVGICHVDEVELPRSAAAAHALVGDGLAGVEADVEPVQRRRRLRECEWGGRGGGARERERTEKWRERSKKQGGVKSTSDQLCFPPRHALFITVCDIMRHGLPRPEALRGSRANAWSHCRGCRRSRAGCRPPCRTSRSAHHAPHTHTRVRYHQATRQTRETPRTTGGSEESRGSAIT